MRPAQAQGCPESARSFARTSHATRNTEHDFPVGGIHQRLAPPTSNPELGFEQPGTLKPQTTRSG